MASFFKPKKNKKFDYQPRYYDERKERLENLKKQYGDDSKESIEMRMKGRFRRQSNHSVPGLFSKATLRTFIILGLLVLAVYYLLKHYNINF